MSAPAREMLDAVQDWYQRRPEDQVKQAIVPLLRERFGIGLAEALMVIRQARDGGANAP